MAVKCLIMHNSLFHLFHTGALDPPDAIFGEDRFRENLC